MFIEKHAVNRILRKLSPIADKAASIAAQAYRLHVEFGFTAPQIAKVLYLNVQTAGSAVRAGRWLNDYNAFTPAQLRLAYLGRFIIRQIAALTLAA